MKKIILMSSLALAACSSKNDVAMNEHYQAAIIAKEKARMDAIKEIAAQGEAGAVAAAMMMQNTNTTHASPNSGKDSALGWAGILVPSIVQATGIAVNADVARTQSNNNTTIATTNSNNNKDVAIDTNSTMASIAEATIVNPEVVTSTNTTTVNTVCVTDADYSCD
ncbi:MAG: hypothetical protein ACO23H_06510 [Alphaproteobacteria bacterium]|jgi:hypothetical protein